MASKVLKCDRCNIVIDEVLAFVQNKADIMNKDNLVQICNTAFSAEDIKRAKMLLFESIPSSTMKARRNKGKTIRDIEDIVSLIKGVDAELLPIFVAKDLNKLPPVCFDHVDPTRLLKDILLLQNEFHKFKTQYVTKEDLRVFQSELENIKRASIVNDFNFVNHKRGAHVMDSYTCNSGPIGLNPLSLEFLNPQSTDNTTLTSVSAGQQNCEIPPVASPVANLNDSKFSSNDYRDTPDSSKSFNTERITHIVNKQSSSTSNTKPVSDNTHSQCTTTTTSAQVAVLDASEFNSQQLYSQAVGRELEKITTNSNREKEVGVNNKWQVVTAKKTKRNVNHFVGKMGKRNCDLNCKFKSVEVKVPLHISHVCKDTREEDIIEYIKDKTGEIVILYKINLPTERRYDSYKLYVSKSKMEMLLDDSFWPKGITYRRFAKRINKYQEVRGSERLINEAKNTK